MFALKDNLFFVSDLIALITALRTSALAGYANQSCFFL